MKKKPLLLKKKPLLFLTLFCSLMFLVICRVNASTGTFLKEVTVTTPTQTAFYSADFSISASDFGLSNIWSEDSNKYSIAFNVTPVYNNIMINTGSKKMNIAQDPEVAKRITGAINISNSNGSFDPVYDKDGMVSSFSRTYSGDASETTYFYFLANLPDEDEISSIMKECGYTANGKKDETEDDDEFEDDEDEDDEEEDNEDEDFEDDEDFEIVSVQYSIKFKVKAGISLIGGASPAVKLKNKSISGYVNYMYSFGELVANHKANYKIVKAKSSDSSVASVSVSTGKLILKKTGTCTITLTNRYGCSASLKVTVKKSVLRKGLNSVTCSLGIKTNIDSTGAVHVLGTPKYKVKSSNSSIISVQKISNLPYITCKKLGSAVLTFTSKGKKFSVRVKVAKPTIAIASSITMKKGDSRTISANDCTDDIYITKATSINGLLSVSIISNSRKLTLTANKSFSGTSTSDKVAVTFNNGAKRTIKVKITQPKPKPFSLKDVKIKLIDSYWDGNDACLKYTITNNSSKDLQYFQVKYTGEIYEPVSGYININYSIPRGKSVTFTTKLDQYIDYIEGAKLTLVSAS